MRLMTFIGACSTFFGRLPGESLADFAAEVRALTEADRVELTALFRTVGIDATRAS